MGKIIKYTFWSWLYISLIFSGCSWDPSHDNPVDPKYRIPPHQYLVIRVLNLNLADQQPIPDATVLLPELGRVKNTDDEGWVNFDDMPVGTYWAVAYKGNGENPEYAIDSIQVTVNFGSTTARIRLDALPVFEEVTANAMTFIYSRAELPEKKIRLQAKIYDPDGAADLVQIEWSFDDLSGNMNWHQHSDSAFYWVDIPSDSFADGQIDVALTQPFYIKAFTGTGNSSQVSTSLVRIITEIVDLQEPHPEGPTIFWNYNWDNDFSDTQQFSYLIRIYRDDIDDNTMVYEARVSDDDSAIEHTVTEFLPDGDYFHYVWVLDHFGNFSRSKKVALRILKSFK